MEPKAIRSVLIKKEGKMRKALAGLDAERRAELLWLADLGFALSAAGFITSFIRLVVNLL